MTLKWRSNEETRGSRRIFWSRSCSLMDKCTFPIGSIRDGQLALIDLGDTSEYCVTILENDLRIAACSSQRSVDQQELQYAALSGAAKQWLKKAFPIRP